jgi:hypothetical protein
LITGFLRAGEKEQARYKFLLVLLFVQRVCLARKASKGGEGLLYFFELRSTLK